MNKTTENQGSPPELLGLSSVLVTSLPPTLLTKDEPERYQVEAVFTRRPTQDEIAAIQHPDSRQVLAEAGYNDIQLSVADRRLKINDTSLQELRDGLGTVIADLLATISAREQAEANARIAWAAHVAEEAHDRAVAVEDFASQVNFTTSHPASGTEPQTVLPKADQAEIDNWTDEGGHKR